MTLFGLVLVILLSWGFDTLSHRIVMNEKLHNIKNISSESARYLDSHLQAIADIALTLSTAPIVEDGLQKSNYEFAALTDEERAQKIDSLNRQWVTTADVTDPFVQARMTNPVAAYLKSQHMIIPGMYGEIFLTNRYGAMIATTGMLTTLAHDHKYWWVSCYHDGQGRIFLDDRGFDTSVQGYVLGVVVPIKDKNGIIGILKCNVIMGPLTEVVQDFGRRYAGTMKIVRTGGLIVSERNAVPLSHQVSEELAGLLRQQERGAAIVTDTEENQLVAFTPVQTTMGSKKIGFGGSPKSLDHSNGNTGEGWHVVISLAEEAAIETAQKTTRLIFIAGVIFAVLAAVVALLLGKWQAGPIVALAATAGTIGEGHLDARADVTSHDEIGSLAQSLNTMAQNLQKTMTSRDELIKEVKQREQAEAVLQKRTGDLNERVRELNCLFGIASLLETKNISFEEILQGVVTIIPSSWQHPEMTCARIVLGDREYATKNFRQSPWLHSRPIIVQGKEHGQLEVFYLGEKPISDEGPFLQEEQRLINAVALRVGEIVEHKRAEEALAQSEKSFRNLVANIPGVIYRCALNGARTMRFISDEIEEIFGYPATDFIDSRIRSYAGIIHPDDAVTVKEAVMRGVGQRQPFIVEYRIIDAEGRIHWLYEKGQALFGDNDEPLYLDGAIFDVTERKQAETLATRLGRIVEYSLNEVYIFDAETFAFMLVNRGARENMGYSMDELTRMTPLDIKPEFTAEFFEELIAPLRTGQKEMVQFNTVHRRKDATLYPVEVHLQLTTFGSSPAFVAIILDITERKRADQKREKLLNDLQEALSKVKKLGGLLPICASCKKIRDDKGYWNQIEAYICNHSEAEFSHSICPECARKLYPDIYEKK